ncbi:MAG TPA: GntR family transcriptional regulator [Ramlibacter sp.]|uniref:GntR family transcriptional regulator n=1 Tax=Ramlibacter sp. TaxID=1917967 RepID=UPI002D112673|nr:GntR family transcriptional regulator [Ramlibacter sp.]HVZ45961.1 GntR family transcriptional regulator [Ramlibacter sp.]
MVDMSAVLVRGSERALYEQITDMLRHQLTSGLAKGDQLPTEAELVERFATSRATVRRAMQQLVDEGVLTRRRGKGTFLARPMPKVVHPIDRVMPFMETFKQVGEDVHTKLIHFGWEESPVLPEALNGWDRPVLTFQRLYVSRGVPHAVTSVIVPRRIGRMFSHADVEKNPIYHMLQKKAKVTPVRAEFLVSCRQPTPQLSEVLEMSRSSLLLVLERISRDAEGHPVEYSTHFLRPDVYQLSVAIDDLPSRRS